MFKSHFACFQVFKRQMQEILDYGDTKVICFIQLVAHECFFARVFVCMCEWIYFATIKKIWNTNLKNGSVREYIIKYLAKR